MEKLLSSGGEPGSPGETFCHPLCSCDKCETLHTRYVPLPDCVLMITLYDFLKCSKLDFGKAKSNDPTTKPKLRTCLLVTIRMKNMLDVMTCSVKLDSQV